MKQQASHLTRKPVKSLSARTFLKSARKKQQKSPSNRVDKMHTEPIQPHPLFTNIKQHAQLNYKTSRLINPQSRRQFIGFKTVQHLQMENQTLKTKLNDISQVLHKERSKHNHEVKNMAKIHKQYDAQFDNDKYFDHFPRSGSNLVEGVKYQYHKMKQKYEEKCSNFNELLARYEVSAGQEHRFYSEALEIDNKKLRKKLASLLVIQENLFQQLQDQQRGEIAQKGGLQATKEWKTTQERRISQLLSVSSDLVTLTKRAEDAERRYAKLKQKYHNSKQILQQKKRKIAFLDKLVTEKSNQMHKITQRQRKLGKQYKLQSQTLEKIQILSRQQQQRHSAAIQLVRERQSIKFETERAIFVNSLEQKQKQIQKLTNEVHYLSTIISYIKTGDDPFPPSEASKKGSIPPNSKDFLINLEKTLVSVDGNNAKGANRKRVKTLIQSGLRQLQMSRKDSRMQDSNSELKQVLLDSQDDFMINSQIGESQGPEQNEKSIIESRMIKRSYLKHSADSLMSRHIKPSLIEHLKKELIYRLMYNKIEFSQLKMFFDFNSAKKEEMSRRERRWNQHFVTMREVKQILLSFPFSLEQKDAFLLSRYIVEDSTKQTVYLNLENEVERDVAKSIIRAFIGEYSLPNQEQAKIQIRLVLENKGKNLQSALTSLAPTGFISDIKFCQICSSIQVDFSESTKNYILSQFFSRSTQGLCSLQYEMLFQEDF